MRDYAVDVLKNSEAMTALKQIRALWTAFCIHQETQVDTNSYDHDLLCLWNTIATHENQLSCEHLKSFDAFDRFMCELLV